MSRLQRIIHGIASGYAVLVTTAIYSLVSIPLALHYLSGARFGLWTLMASIGACLNLIDLGMSASMSRLLVDHKDDRANGSYGGLIKTGWLVSTVQGVLVFFVGFFIAPFLSGLFKIEPELQSEFIQLLRWQCVILAFSFIVRIGGQLLFAHQRMDIGNYAQMGMCFVNFTLLWFFFHLHCGVFSLAWAGLGAAIFNAGIILFFCVRLKLFPKPGAWGEASWLHFREIFNYGTDLFLVAVGAQLIIGSQAMIVTRVLGLEAAGVWNVGTKMYNLLCQVVWSVPRMSSPAFSEMIVRQERDKLLERYRAVFMLTLSLSGFAAVSMLMCNSLFVPFLSHHQFTWPLQNDVLLGVLLIIAAIVNCHNSFILLTKKISLMRYVYFIEGAVFVGLSLLTAKWGGMPMIILTSIVCASSFSGAYGVRRIANYFQLPLRAVVFSWFIPTGRMLLFFVLVALIAWFITAMLDDLLLRLAINAIFCGVVGSYFFLRFGLSNTLQLEILERVPKKISPILRRIFALSAP